MAEPLLDISGLDTGYGKVGVLHGIDFHVAAGEIVALLGPDGAGTSTLLRAISGLLPATGIIRLDSRSIVGQNPRDAVAAGLVHVVEGHRVFTGLPVHDNLLFAGYALPKAEQLRRAEMALECLPRSPPSEPNAAEPSPAANNRCSPSRKAWRSSRA